ncbi:hypothetical protein DCE93_02960 [Agromyces badenianii]|uniref:Uncharacterized protein n=1 Tax=Agromyces badenianii TaxID=2080742 RepID=A0A2S0WTS7_9MICO|nr:hypothetical protein [Agromyces badenianii]AWB94743.1 hypothetical protein DCE93_02960 [Agromyces badenianii]
MYLSEDYFVFELHQRGEERLLKELERRRVIAERLAERAAERAAEAAELQVTDVSRPPFIVRWRRRLGRLAGPTFGAHGGGPTPIAS